MKYEHLNSETREILNQKLSEKVRWARKEHFIRYPKAKKCIQELNWVMSQKDMIEDTFIATDLESFSLIGDSGVGKTAIIQEFTKTYRPKHHRTHEGYPVAYAMLKDSITGLKGLYSSLLSAFNHPYADADTFRMKKITIDQLENVLLYTMKNVGTKLFFIDEFQHVKGRNQQSILNQLKRTMLVSKVPFIPVGVLEVKDIIALDTQLSDRCPVKPHTHLTPWQLGNDFRLFLKGYEKFLPFKEPSELSKVANAKLIFKKALQSSGKSGVSVNLRNIVKVLKRIAVYTLNQNHAHICAEDIENGVF